MEIWKDIAGYKGHYQVSNYGRIRNRRGKVLSPGDNGKGYMHVSLCMGGRCKSFNVHTLVAKAFIPNDDEELEVNHKNGVKADNHVDNLEWITHQENCRHRFAVLGHVADHACKLTVEEVNRIRAMINHGGRTQQEIANIFNIERSTISKIKTGDRWSSVQ